MIIRLAQLERLPEKADYGADRYRDAIDHAASAGSRGGVKIAFDLRDEKRRGLPTE